MDFGITPVFSFQLLPLVLGVRSCGIIKSQNISENKRKRFSIREKVYFDYVCLSYIVYFILIYIMTILY